MPNAYGFQEQTVQGGAGVVIAGKAATAQHAQPKQVPAPAAPIENRQFVIPYTDKQSRIQYLEHVRDFLNNELALVEAALKQERGY